MTKRIEWQTGAGQAVVVTITRTDSEIVSADGHEVEIARTRIEIVATVDGVEVGRGSDITPTPSHPVCVASIGKLGLTTVNARKVKDALYEMRPAPRPVVKSTSNEVYNAMTLNGRTY